jgi:hypothetical protein
MVFSALGSLIGAGAVMQASSKIVTANFNAKPNTVANTITLQKNIAPAQISGGDAVRGTGRSVPRGLSPPARPLPIDLSFKSKLDFERSKIRERLGI